MSWVTGFFVYGVIWWLVLFTVLPWGVRQPNAAETAPGQMAGAPHKPRMWLKVAITSVIAAVLWVGAYYLITTDLISFREMAK